MIKRHWMIALILANAFAAFGQPMKPPLGSRINREHPLANGLVACWLMNEGGGTVINDLTNNRITGTTNAVWRPGKLGCALDCVAANSNSIYCAASQNILPNGWGPFSLICWMTPANINTTNNWLFGLGDKNISSSYSNGVIQSAGDDYRYNLSSFGNIGTWTTWGKGGLTCFSFVFESTTSRKLYMNGILWLTDTDSVTPEGNPNKLAVANVGGSGSLYTNTVPEMCFLYNRALTASEIKQLYISPFSMLQPIVRRGYYVEAGVTANFAFFGSDF